MVIVIIICCFLDTFLFELVSTYFIQVDKIGSGSFATASAQAEIKFDKLIHNFGSFEESNPVQKCIDTNIIPSQKCSKHEKIHIQP